MATVGDILRHLVTALPGTDDRVPEWLAAIDEAFPRSEPVVAEAAPVEEAAPAAPAAPPVLPEGAWRPPGS